MQLEVHVLLMVSEELRKALHVLYKQQNDCKELVEISAVQLVVL